ncbi:DUF4159 domain-containing protein [Mangrovivirga cuniculi]|uniref:DUF4159 domain-containing protein n=1 Tax=Mangrovivirga cuniculi TaxID=2715131 RepID=A0A4D7K6N2_9BACT|nr:DUF4159 domain-containing protein [Mangrovivirga cuniculi]QCK15058.1 hypothetical protein DCC35_10015 [Mangrovivirga cuniculi]
MKVLKISLFFLLTAFSINVASAQLKLAQLEYNGGGDWYANKTGLKNLSIFCNRYLGTSLNPNYDYVEVGSKSIFEYPYLYMTGHGNVVFSDTDAENLRLYLTSGGFLHIDDNYGLDQFIRLELKKVFPDKELVEIPFNHPIYHQKFDFEGLPKIHEHDGKPAQGLGIFHEGRLVIFYSYESDLGNGWEDPSIHGDPESVRLKALQMGANIISYIFLSQ